MHDSNEAPKLEAHKGLISFLRCTIKVSLPDPSKKQMPLQSFDIERNLKFKVHDLSKTSSLEAEKELVPSIGVY